MFGVLLTILILDGLLLMVIVLLQSGKGGGLAAMGGGMGTETLVGGRQAATILTKATWVAGGLFLGLSLVLSIMSSSAREAPESVLQQEFQQGVPAQPEPVLPGVEQGQQGGEGAGAAEQPQPLELPGQGEDGS